MFPSQSGSWYDKKMSSLGGPDSLAPTPHTSETASERSRMGPATLWVPVHCGREDVENAPPRLPTQARLGRTGLYTRCSYALRPKNYLIPSYSERRGLRRPWEGGRRWRRSSVGADVGPGGVYTTLGGKGLRVEFLYSEGKGADMAESGRGDSAALQSAAAEEGGCATWVCGCAGEGTARVQHTFVLLYFIQL